MDGLAIAGLVVGSALIGLSNIPVVWSLCRRSSSGLHDGYCDEDGEATEASIKMLGGKWPRRCIFGLSVLGLACSSAMAVLSTLKPEEEGFERADTAMYWCQFSSWVFSTFQSVALLTERPVLRRYTLAHCAFWTSIGTVVLTSMSIHIHTGKNDNVRLALDIANSSNAILRAVFCLVMPRRPDVYYQGRIVDREYSTSLWGRLTFSFITSFLRFSGRREGKMATDDFPQLPYRARSERLLQILQQAYQHGQSLFRVLCKVHSGAFVLQVILALVCAVFTFGPHAALYGILRSLEDRSLGSPGIWAAFLGVALCLASTLSSWVWWITYSKLAIPISSELQALLYKKSMRRKDIQQPKEAEASGDAKESPESVQQQGQQQEVINLVTVDTKRISDYASYNHLIPSSVAQFIIACICLLFLIGWQSLFAGLLAVVLMSPVNVFIAQEYRTFQQGMMQAKDHRTALIHEIVQNIRQIKFSATGPAWEGRALQSRKRELHFLLQACFRETGFVAIWTLTPLLLSAVSLTVYALKYGTLSASVAFTAISIFGSLEVALAALPHLISTALEAKMSVDRIDEYMQSPDKASTSLSEPSTSGITFEDAAIAWPASEGSDKSIFSLSGLNFKFPPRGLALISGRTGSGKSLLLSSILGECDVLHGSLQVPACSEDQWRDPPSGITDWIIANSQAYVAQSPWTENGSIRDNILFGLPFDRARYQDVLFASALERDLEILTDGDETDIGANGVNLSGGQRTRVSLARALYSRAGILILDDIFSALDADTSKHIYEHGLTGRLAQNRTRILATHHLGLCLPKSDYCVLLEKGSISFSGPVERLKNEKAFSAYFNPEASRTQVKSHSSTPVAEVFNLQDNGGQARKFSPEEQRETGAVSWRVYRRLFTGEGSQYLWFLGFSASILYTTSVFGRSWWLHIWTGSNQVNLSQYANYASAAATLAVQKLEQLDAPDDLFKYIGVYIGISLAAAIMATLQVLFFRTAAMRSSQALFKTLLSAVLAAPLRWVDTVPLGRVLNRFTSDVYIVDYVLGTHISELVSSTLQICGVLVASTSVSPAILGLAAVLLAASLRLAVLYLAAAREVKRLESVSRSPILEHFISSLSGLTTIRAFDQGRKYVQAMFSRIDAYASVSRHLWLFNWWLQLRISVFGAIFATVTAALVVKFGVSASLAGFAISFVLQYNNAVSTMIRVYTSFEMEMNAAERVIDYASIDTEPQDGLDPPAAWPTQGLVTVDNLTVSYAPELPPALEDVTFTIESNERIGVVGRTGSGKSTLALALFRLLEASQGTVCIDGLDTSRIKLEALRSRGLAIVPQHPTLFAGTIRSNLDPFDWYSEAELMDALDRVHLNLRPSSSKFGPRTSILDIQVTEGGANLSQGQRQLLCLARAILQRPKVMILDEATSAVDMETDGLIQQAIRTEFGRQRSSLLVIAHRLSTIADFDRVLVMGEGRVVEFGEPRELLKIEGGAFRDLVNQSGEKALLEDIITGRFR